MFCLCRKLSCETWDKPKLDSLFGMHNLANKTDCDSVLLCWLKSYFLPVKLVWGGKTKPHSEAQEDAWRKILAFLQTHLYSSRMPRAKMWIVCSGYKLNPNKCILFRDTFWYNDLNDNLSMLVYIPWFYTFPAAKVVPYFINWHWLFAKCIISLPQICSLHICKYTGPTFTNYRFSSLKSGFHGLT